MLIPCFQGHRVQQRIEIGIYDCLQNYFLKGTDIIPLASYLQSVDAIIYGLSSSLLDKARENSFNTVRPANHNNYSVSVIQS